jgi:hypothetical protein
VGELDDLSSSCATRSRTSSRSKQPEGTAVRVDGWRTLQEALEVIADSRRRFDEQGG